MQLAWLCVVINKNLRARGEEEASLEVKRLSGDAFVDFRMSDDGFEGDCYCFVKCKIDDISFLQKFRRSSMIVAVLES